MPLPLPRSLSPSKMSSFCSCPLAFKFSVIDRIPEPASAATVKGTLVHRALERLFWHHDRGDRSRPVAVTELDRAWDELQSDDEYLSLGLTERESMEFLEDAAKLVAKYFDLEDPDSTRTVGVELMLEAELDGVLLRGIIDRLDIDESGGLVIIDYKTGRAPGETHEHARLSGVHTYALLCEKVFGVLPTRIKLLYLRDRLTIEAVPSKQSTRGTGIRTAAVWNAITRACDSDDFRPSVSPLCRYCSFRHLCPAVGGDLKLAAFEARREGPGSVFEGQCNLPGPLPVRASQPS